MIVDISFHIFFSFASLPPPFPILRYDFPEMS
jgi:hypothetical protein